jgi:hypothetical protein
MNLSWPGISMFRWTTVCTFALICTIRSIRRPRTSIRQVFSPPRADSIPERPNRTRIREHCEVFC